MVCREDFIYMSISSTLQSVSRASSFYFAGKGCNESVFVSLAKHRPTNTYVAIKRTNLERCDLEFNIIHVSTAFLDEEVTILRAQYTKDHI